MDVFGDEFVLHVEDVLSHDICVDDAREAGRDPFDVPLHGSALPDTFEYYLGLSRRFRTVPFIIINIALSILRIQERADSVFGLRLLPLPRVLFTDIRRRVLRLPLELAVELPIS